MEELQKVLEKMPNTFTSNSFNVKARKCGISENILQNGTSVAFLKANCRNISKRLWAKLPYPPIFQTPEDGKAPIIKLALKDRQDTDQMIANLKSLGYKVLKPSWQEL